MDIVKKFSSSLPRIVFLSLVVCSIYPAAALPLEAGNPEGVGNGEATGADLAAETRYVQTPWFFALVAFSVAAIGGGAMRWRQLALLRREETLRELVAVRTAELEKLAGLAERINSAMLPEEVLQHVFDSFRPTIPYDRIGFADFSEDRKTLRAAWACSDAETLSIAAGFEAPLKGSSLATILETGEPRIINDLEAHLHEHPDSAPTRRIVEEGMRSSLTCPLFSMGEPLGFLFFSSRRTGTFSNVHVDFFSQIADQLASAIARSRLYEDLLMTRVDLEDANRRLNALANQDGLTGLANRRALDARLEEEWRRCARNRTCLSFLMIDIDHFKLYNDERGHLEGDECLRRVAAELAESFQRSGDFPARYGGEEFAVVLPDIDGARAERAADRFRRRLEALELPHDASPVGPWVTVSIGIATVCPLSGDSVVDLARAADDALYEAKQTGRNRCLRALIPDRDGAADLPLAES